MRFAIALLPVLVLACGGGSTSSPPPATPLPPEGAGASESKPAEGTGETASNEGGMAGAAEPSAPICPKPADDGAAATPASQEEIDAMAVKGIAMMEKMAVVFEANADDCGKLTGQLREFIGNNCTELNNFRVFSKRTTKQQQEQFNAKYGDKMMAVGMKMMPALQKCQNDARLMDLMGQMGGQ